MKTIEEAVSVRNWVLGRIESHPLLTDAEARRRALTFVIVGGSLRQYRDHLRARGHGTRLSSVTKLSVSDLHFVLIEAAPRIMPEVPRRPRREGCPQLRARSIEFCSTPPWLTQPTATCS